MSPTPSSHAAFSDLGPRVDNQDAWLALPELGVYAVADGMGGLADGRHAADTSLAAIRSQAPEVVAALRASVGHDPAAVVDLLDGWVQSANRHVRLTALARHGPRPPRSGCTLTVAVVLHPNRLLVVHVGDSRAIVVRDGAAHVVTEDHSVAMARVRRGSMSLEEARHSPLRNRLYQAVGLLEEVQPDITELDLRPGDRVVLCSDGLWEPLEDSELASMVGQRTPEGACAALRAGINAAGLIDNTTALVIDPVPTPLEVDRAEVLGGSRLFQGLDEHETHRLLPFLVEHRLAADECVVEEGEEGGSVFIVAAGTLQVHHGSTLLHTLHSGDHFGEISLLKGGLRTASVSANTAAVLLELAPEHIDGLILRRPALGARVALRIASHLADRVVALGSTVNES